MKFIGKLVGTGLAVAAVAVVACSNSPGPSSSGGSTTTQSTQNTGAVGFNLTLPGGEQISTVNYTLTNGTHTLSGQYNITNTATLSFVIGSVPSGTGYSLTLTATTNDGTVTCSYPAVGDPAVSNITVVNRTTTVVNVNLQCVNNQGLDSGSVTVNAVQSNCPVWNTIVANPVNITLDGGANVNDGGTLGATAVYPGSTPTTADILDGQSIVLVGAGTFPNQSAIAFDWSVSPAGASLSSTGGTIDPNSNASGTTDQTVFTCPATGATATYTVTLTLSDGALPDGGSCDPKFTTGTVQVECQNPGVCSGAPYAATFGGACNQWSQGGTPPTDDPNGYPYITTSATNTGTLADGGTVYCCAGACGDTGTYVGDAGTCPTTDAGAPQFNNNGCCAPLVPCTSASQIGGCVECEGNTNNLCTVTESYLVQLDINKGIATVPGPDPSTGCYTCAYQALALDSTSIGTTGKECEDLPFGDSGSTIVNGSGQTVNDVTTCEAVVQCVESTGCGSTTNGQQYCYCGPGGGSPSVCSGTTSGQNGACYTQEIAGFTFAPGDAHDILLNYTSVTGTEPSGVANHVFSTAVAGGGCTQCLQ